VGSARITGQTSAKNYAHILAPRLLGPEGNRQMLIEKLAPSGSFVRKGDIVVEMDSTNSRDHIDDVQDTVDQSKLDLSKRKAEQALDWENLQQTLRVAKSELDIARLDASASEIRTPVDQELIRLAVEEAEARHKQLSADLASQRAVHQAELRILELTHERHSRHLNRHIADLQKFTIRAPMDGLVVMQQLFRSGQMAQLEQGDQVFPGQAIMKIVNTASMQLEAQVNQAESSHFRIGQRALIRVDAFNDLRLEGKITSIGALAAGGWRNSFFIRNVPVKLDIIGTDPRLIPDLSASAEVFLDRVDQALIAPRGAFQREGDETVAYVKKGESFERRVVKLGLQNHTHAAILSGLNSGDELRLGQ
jgi:multidrug efflux pump subunit AcrA (membrane-fusion protein)